MSTPPLTITRLELILSLTRADFQWSFTKGSGAGGQKRNKTSSAVHCFHEASGAHGYSEAGRSQTSNRQDAFTKTVNSTKFRTWLRLEVAKRIGKGIDIDQEVDRLMAPENLKLEIRRDGQWIDASLADLQAESPQT